MYEDEQSYINYANNAFISIQLIHDIYKYGKHKNVHETFVLATSL